MDEASEPGAEAEARLAAVSAGGPTGAAAPHGDGAEPGPRRSLRTPILLALLVANLVTFVVLLTATDYTARENRRVTLQNYADWQEDYSYWLASQLDEIVDRTGVFRIPKAMNWRGWRRFEDVIVAQRPEPDPLQEPTALPRLTVPGVFLNPLGRSQRNPDFDEQRALRMIADSVAARESLSTGFGTAAPIGLPGEAPWGGVWFRPKAIEMNEFPRQRLIVFFVGTLALFTGLVLLLLQRTVLDPVRHLAGVVQRLESADLGARAKVSTARNDEMAQLGRGFNDMAVRLQSYNQDLQAAVDEATVRVKEAEAAAMTQRRLAATGELAAGVAHELNNPLGGLANAVEAMGRKDMPEARREEYLRLVSSGLARMGETVGRLLRLAPREAQLDRVDLVRPLGDALGLIRHRAEGMGVALEVAGPGEFSSQDSEERFGWRPAFEASALQPFAELPPIQGAANELGQGMLNLFVNALDAIEEGRSSGQVMLGPGRISLSMTRHGDSSASEVIRVECQDDGPGASEEVMDRVADAFFTTKEQGKGTGLGLAIVHNVVAAHGGRVLLHSEPAAGFRVTLELPVTQAASDAPDPGEPA